MSQIVRLRTRRLEKNPPATTTIYSFALKITYHIAVRAHEFQTALGKKETYISRRDRGWEFCHYTYIMDFYEVSCLCMI